MRLAHSAPSDDRAPQEYRDHIQNVLDGARRAAEEVARHMSDPAQANRFVCAVADAALFHDLGKLDPDTQAALGMGRSARLRWDHVDAGVAHLLQAGAKSAAWLVRAHHSPGLPARIHKHHNALTLRGRDRDQRLRGRRRDDAAQTEHQEQIVRTDKTLGDLLAAHFEDMDGHSTQSGRAEHGLFLRLGLSCLVDGDHADTAGFDSGWTPPDPPQPRWRDRLDHLDAYVRSLRDGGARQTDRDDFYRACRDGTVDMAMASCEGPVGIGKTTAVAAWLLRRAMATGARRIIVVAPYTTILSQTADRLRRALVLPDETGRADEVVAEHHHRADFSAIESRDLAVLWQAPIVLTTSVQFFETLSACEPARLRKLHALPGSAVFLDEAHAALPAHLWRQNWAWVRELARSWGCSFVFASGSLARVWEEEEVVGPGATACLPDLVPPDLAQRLNAVEHRRVRLHSKGRIDSLAELASTLSDRAGPRLVVVNTVSSAATIARYLREDAKHDTLHLSTALCPNDRARILAQVVERLDAKTRYPQDWTLVATSLVEAGVDLSFRTALRERFSASSLIQIGGRVNRHGGDGGAGEVIDFRLSSEEGLTLHPGARQSAEVLGRLFKSRVFETAFEPAEIVTHALREEIRDQAGQLGSALVECEREANYPEVALKGRLIDADTRLVVVRADLYRRLIARQPVSSRELLGGSVQIWNNKREWFGLGEIATREGAYWWPYKYDPDFLGYMEGVRSFSTGEAFLV